MVLNNGSTLREQALVDEFNFNNGLLYSVYSFPNMVRPFFATAFAFPASFGNKYVCMYVCSGAAAC